MFRFNNFWGRGNDFLYQGILTQFHNVKQSTGGTACMPNPNCNEKEAEIWKLDQ